MTEKNYKGSLQRFIKNSGIFFIGACLSKIVVFLLLPLYTTVIPTGDYGYYDLSIVYITILSSILFFDVWVGGMRFLYECADENEKRKIVLSVIISFSISALFFTLIGIVTGIILNIKYIILIILYGLTTNLHNLYAFITRGYQKNLDFAISGILNTVILAVTNIILLTVLNFNFSSLYISAILGNLFQCFYLEIRVKLRNALNIQYYDKKVLREIVKYSLPLCINSISYWLLTAFNRIIIERVYSLDINGIYAIGNKFSSVISLATTCFTYAWQDLSFDRKSNDPENGKFFGRASCKYLLFLSYSTAVILPAISIVFPWIISEQYSDAYNTVMLFIIVAVISAVSTFIGNIFYAIKDTKSIFISMTVSSIFNVVMCYPLIKFFGINGANLSILISFILNILIRYIILRKRINYHIEYKPIILSFFILAVSCIVFYLNNITFTVAFLMVVLIFGLINCKKQIYKIASNLYNKCRMYYKK